MRAVPIPIFIFFLLCNCSGDGSSAADTDEDAELEPDEEATDTIDPGRCETDEDCSNGLVCDGEEKCIDGECQPGEPLECEDEDFCTMDDCDEEVGGCIHEPLDEDEDGYIAEYSPEPERMPCGGTDCDDLRNDAYPGAAETECDWVDNDCNGIYEIIDDDEDTIGDEYCGGEDCNDLDENIYPGAPAQCDYVDDDCSGYWWDEAGADDDEDHYLDESCGGDDCDDTSDMIYPDAVEACDIVDNDCDGSWADGGADDDEDGYLDIDCGGDDCEDSVFTVHPGISEVCDDGDDNNCDGLTDYFDPACPVSNDLCSGALSITDGVEIIGATIGMADNYAIGCGGSPLIDVTFYFTLEESHSIRIRVECSFNAYVSVETECGNSDTEIGCGLSSLDITGLGAGTYYVIVDGDSEDGFILSLDLDP